MLGVDRVTRRHVVLVIWSQWTGSVGSCVVRLTPRFMYFHDPTAR
jgi:hypothetical protein